MSATQQQIKRQIAYYCGVAVRSEDRRQIAEAQRAIKVREQQLAAKRKPS